MDRTIARTPADVSSLRSSAFTSVMTDSKRHLSFNSPFCNVNTTGAGLVTPLVSMMT